MDNQTSVALQWHKLPALLYRLHRDSQEHLSQLWLQRQVTRPHNTLLGSRTDVGVPRLRRKYRAVDGGPENRTQPGGSDQIISAAMRHQISSLPSSPGVFTTNGRMISQSSWMGQLCWRLDICPVGGNGSSGYSHPRTSERGRFLGMQPHAMHTQTHSSSMAILQCNGTHEGQGRPDNCTTQHHSDAYGGMSIDWPPGPAGGRPGAPWGQFWQTNPRSYFG